MNSIRLRLLFVMCAAAVCTAAHAADKPGRFFKQGQGTSRAARPHGPPPREMSRQLFESVEAGDSYVTPEGPRKLRRLAGAIAIPADEKPGRFTNALLAAGQALAGYEADAKARHGLRILRAVDSEKRAQLGSPAKLEMKIRQLRATDAGRSANPVFIDPQTGLQLLATTKVIVGLKPGTEARALFGAAWSRARPLEGTERQFLLTLPGANADEVFAEVKRLSALPEVEWAEPDFVMQVRKNFTPNDPLFPDQWHLSNTGQLDGKSGADAKLIDAWDITRGSSNIVIAILDDGVQMDHPDLAANIFINPGEIPGNGVDDDNNGYIDDVHGWDFYGNGTIGDNDPSPSDELDNHGTALAGVAAGVGNNALGISGAAPGCRIMPVKVIEGTNGVLTSDFTSILRYAGGRVGGTNGVWRGADVINISLTFSDSTAINSALAEVTAHGHGGRGVPIFCAAGNGAGAWRPVDLDFPEGRVYRLIWEYVKDGLDDPELSTGADTVWLDSVVFPDGTIEDFEGNGLPPGWVTGGTDGKGWKQVTAGVNGNHALTGWNGAGSRALRAGRIGDDEFSYLDFETYIDAGRFTFWIWTESEAGFNESEDFVGFDRLEFFVDGVFLAEDFGVPSLETTVAYPASNPNTIAVGSSTDFDFRSDYSQYGSALDFLAPSDGGLNAITTTDRTGINGYNHLPGSDYDHLFGGTSSATPLASGVAALLLSANPFLTAVEVRALMRGTCDKIGGEAYDSSGRNNRYGYGRLNAEGALSKAATDLSVTLTSSPSLVFPGETSLYTITVRNRGASRSGPVTVLHEFPVSAAFVSSQPSPVSRVGNLVAFTNAGLAAGASVVFKVTVTNLITGDHLASVSVSNVVLESSYENNTASASTTVVPIPDLSIGDATLTEGDSKSTNLVFRVSLSNPSARNVTLNYATASGTAVSGKDFSSAKGTLKFVPGETNKTITVRVLNDRLDEEDETFAVKLSAVTGAVLTRGQGIGTILDNDALPALSVANKSRVEGNSGSAAMVFSVKLTPASGRAVSVQCSASATGSATDGADFRGTNRVLVFTPGKTLLTFNVPVLGDRLDETNETFSFTFTDATNAVITAGTAKGTITDDDATPKLYVSNASVTEGDSDTTNLVFNIRLAPASGRPVSVLYFTTNGSARADLDFISTNATLIEFPPGVTNQTILVPVLGETLSESNETMTVRLLAPTNAVIEDARGTGTILDDDDAHWPALSIADALVGEPAAGGTNARFQVTLSGVSGRAIKVSYATSNLTARAGSDFTKKTGTLTFAPGVTNVPLNIAISRDKLVETNETFLVQLRVPVNATLDDAQGIGTILGNEMLATIASAASLRLEITRMEAGVLRMDFVSAAGQTYVLEARNSLDDSAAWQAVSGVAPLAGTGGTLDIELPVSVGVSQRFYRLRLAE